MSGHSKWSTIKRKKAAVDAKRSKIFSNIIKEINVAVKEGGSDPEANPRLRLALANAKGANMPKDNIQRAISKAGEKDAADFEQITYEGIAPGGVGIIVECLTDNQQRTVSAIRSYFNKHNGKLETHGALDFIFDRKGVFTVPKNNLDADEFMLEVIDAGAEEVETDDDEYFTIYTAMEDFGSMQKKLEELGLEPEKQELQRIPQTTVSLDKEHSLKTLKLIDMIEEDDDVQNVFHNLELTDEVMQEL
ncbi:MAG: YebC/PmpR family DNA-binding transcriptional regulator [Bacteroidales bacterium]